MKLLFFRLSLLFLYLYILLGTLIDSEGQENFIIQLPAGLALVFMLCYNLFNLKEFIKHFKHWTFIKYWRYFVLLVILYFFLGLADLPTNLANTNPRNVVVALIAFNSLVFAVNAVMNNHLKGRALYLLIAVLVIDSIAEVVITYQTVHHTTVIDVGESSYLIMSIMPLLLYVFRSYYVWVILFVLGLIMFTAKRSAFIIVLACLPVILYYLKHFRRQFKLNKSTIAVLLLITASIILFYVLNIDTINRGISNFIYRMDRLEGDDGSIGSGRNFIWLGLLNYWYEGEMINQLFGFGYFSSNSIWNNVAHNDFVQYLVDYGIVGLVIWTMVLYKFYRNNGKDFKKTRYLSILLLLCFIILCGRSLFSGTIRPGMIFLSLTMGFLIGIKQKKVVGNYNILSTKYSIKTKS